MNQRKISIWLGCSLAVEHALINRHVDLHSACRDLCRSFSPTDGEIAEALNTSPVEMYRQAERVALTAGSVFIMPLTAIRRHFEAFAKEILTDDEIGITPDGQMILGGEKKYHARLPDYSDQSVVFVECRHGGPQ